MTKSILCTVVTGILVGAAAFFMPHLLLGVFIFFGIIGLLHCGCRRHGCCGHGRNHRFEMMDKIRSMSDEEYSEFKNNHGRGCCSSHHSHGNDCCSTNHSDSKDCCSSDSKKNETTK